MESLIEALIELTEAIANSNVIDLSAWIMIAITTIYVLATIFISVANIRSAKAVREQLAEQKRQFDETNRPVVDVTIDNFKGTWVVFTFQNTGLKLAKNVSIKINDKFKEGLSGSGREYVDEILSSDFILGVGKTLTIPICELEQHKNLCDVVINVSYRDNMKDYSDEFAFKPRLYNWRFIDTSELTQIRIQLEKIAKCFNECEK